MLLPGFIASEKLLTIIGNCVKMLYKGWWKKKQKQLNAIYLQLTQIAIAILRVIGFNILRTLNWIWNPSLKSKKFVQQVFISRAQKIGT